jgi:TRAP-type C4-dicarboxylate transport system permease small subunit
VTLRRGILAAFFGIYVLAVTWPGVLPFNHTTPRVLGLPFSFFWVALWVVLGGLALLAFDRGEH